MCDVFHFYVSMYYMIRTILKKLIILVLILMISCDPCSDNGGNPDENTFIFYQSINQNGTEVIFRFDYENFRLREISSDFRLGKSVNNDYTLIFNEDSIFKVDNYSLVKTLIFEKEPGIKVENVYLCKDNYLLILSKDSILYKSDFNNNIEFLDNNVSPNTISIFENNFAYFKNGNRKLVLGNIINSQVVNKDFIFEYEDLSNLSLSTNSIAFTNYDLSNSKIYYFDKNLNAIDEFIEEKGNIKSFLINDELYLYDSNNILKGNEVIYSDNIFEIDLIEYNSKSKFIFMFTLNEFTSENDIYYSLYRNGIGSFSLLINNATAVD